MTLIGRVIIAVGISLAMTLFLLAIFQIDAVPPTQAPPGQITTDSIAAPSPASADAPGIRPVSLR